MSDSYLPVFAEEVFIVNLYGTDEELDEFNRLIESPEKEKNLMTMALLIEEIKRQNVLKMTWHCCWRCRYFKTCKINWYRGERQMKSRHCCTYCQNYWECHKKFSGDDESLESKEGMELCKKSGKLVNL